MPQVTMILPVNKQAANKRRVAAYCRVSSDSDDQLHSYANQIRIYSSMINSRDDWQLVEIFADEGISGTSTEKRTEFQRMITMCENHEIDLIITKSVSRFARNVKDTLEYVRKLKLLGVEVMFEKESISTLSLGDEMLLNTFAAIAQEESVAISQNLRLSIRKRMAEGTYNSSSLPYGYAIANQSNMSISEYEAGVVKRIFDEYLSGKSTIEIADGLNRDGLMTPENKPKWRPKTITYILTNEKYIGDVLLQKTFTSDLPFKKMKNRGEEDQYYVKDSHVAIIDKDKFCAANELIQMRRKRYARYQPKEKYMLSRQITCSICGASYKRRIINGEVYWACANKVSDTHMCESHYLKEREIYEAIITMLNKLRFDESILLHAEQLLSDAVTVSRRYNTQASATNQSIAELNTKLLNIEKLRAKGYLAPEICQAQSKAIEKELIQLKEKRQKMYTSKISTALGEIQKLIAILNRIEEPLENIDEKLFSDVIKGISVNANDTLSIVLHCGLCFEEKVIGGIL